MRVDEMPATNSLEDLKTTTRGESDISPSTENTPCRQLRNAEVVEDFTVVINSLKLTNLYPEGGSHQKDQLQLSFVNT